MAFSSSSHNGMNDEQHKQLWMACAGPLVDVAVQAERVFYFTQGHIKQVQWHAPPETTMPNRMPHRQLEPIRDGGSNVNELEAESSSSRHKRLRTCYHGPMSYHANTNWGDSLNPLHAIPLSSSGFIDKGKECENPQVFRLFGVDIQVGTPYSSGRVTVLMQGKALVQSLDMSSLRGYEELKNKLEKIFQIEGEIHGEKWEVVYEDAEGDLMLLVDKPWWEFCKIVKKILIRASDHEVKKMIHLGFKLYLF